MRQILIAGCGYVGEATADVFHSRGWKVEGWTGSAKSAEHLAAVKPYRVREVDITNEDAIARSGGTFDVVLQCVSSRGGDVEEYRRLYLEGARALLGFFSGATHLFTSSTSVYAQQDEEIVDETSPADPVHEKGRILRATEQLVLERRGIVARLGAIYGPGRSFLLRAFLDGTPVIDPGKDRFVNQVHRDDIASALYLFGRAGGTVGGEVYNVIDDRPILASEAIRLMSNQLERAAPEGVPIRPRKRGNSNKRVSNQKLRNLGWTPRYPNFEIGLRESVLPSFGITSPGPPGGRYKSC